MLQENGGYNIAYTPRVADASKLLIAIRLSQHYSLHASYPVSYKGGVKHVVGPDTMGLVAEHLVARRSRLISTRGSCS